MTLQAVFKFFEDTQLGVFLRKSTYAFPAIEVVHVLGLTLLLGAVLIVDLRLLGAGMRRQSISQVSRSMTPLFWGALVVTLITGATLFLGEAVKCFFNEAFWWKMSLLVLALLFHVTLFRKICLADGKGLIGGKAAAIISLSLWFGVGLAGRVIGFI